MRTVSLSGEAVRSPYGLMIDPEGSIDDVERTDIVIIPTSGLELDAKFAENSALLPWLRRHYDQGLAAGRGLHGRGLSGRGRPA